MRMNSYFLRNQFSDWIVVLKNIFGCTNICTITKAGLVVRQEQCFSFSKHVVPGKFPPKLSILIG